VGRLFLVVFTLDDFLIEQFPGPSALGFYWIRIIRVLMAISAVPGIYHEWLIDLGRLWNGRIIQFNTSFLSVLPYNPICECSDLFNFYTDNVTCLEKKRRLPGEPDTFRRSC
jgi:hypothetical protein